MRCGCGVAAPEPAGGGPLWHSSFSRCDVVKHGLPGTQQVQGEGVRLHCDREVPARRPSSPCGHHRGWYLPAGGVGGPAGGRGIPGDRVRAAAPRRGPLARSYPRRRQRRHCWTAAGACVCEKPQQPDCRKPASLCAGLPASLEGRSAELQPYLRTCRHRCRPPPQQECVALLTDSGFLSILRYDAAQAR